MVDEYETKSFTENGIEKLRNYWVRYTLDSNSSDKLYNFLNPPSLDADINGLYLQNVTNELKEELRYMSGKDLTTSGSNW